MAKFYGAIGFEVTEETRPSVWTPVITERQYAGDVIKHYRRLESGVGINDDLNLQNELSILADPYAMNHFQDMRYVKWHGAYWKVTGVEVSFPRLSLTIGGVYNGPTAET